MRDQEVRQRWRAAMIWMGLGILVMGVASWRGPVNRQVASSPALAEPSAR
jgi:hypothetical protein